VESLVFLKTRYEDLEELLQRCHGQVLSAVVINRHLFHLLVGGNQNFLLPLELYLFRAGAKVLNFFYEASLQRNELWLVTICQVFAIYT
jgi:hypothetical protein